MKSDATPLRRRLGARSNLLLTPELERRLIRIAEAHASFFGAPGASSGTRLTDIKRLAMEVGVSALEAKLGLVADAADEPARPAVPQRSTRR